MFHVEHHQSGLCAITLDRPDKRNALTPAMLDGLTDAVRRADDASAVLVLGTGRVFCAGFDLDLCRNDPADQPTLRALLDGLSGMVRAMRACPAPVVVAAHGAAIAGGAAILGGADIVVADREAKIGYPVVRLGISPAVSMPFVAAQAGVGPARRLGLDPGLIDGAKALSMGLVHELVETREEVVGRAREIAAEIAAKPRGGVRATKAWLNELVRVDGGAGLEASLGLVGSEESRVMLARAWG
jgi:methylglutaconyl-CoA hydratase